MQVATKSPGATPRTSSPTASMIPAAGMWQRRDTGLLDLPPCFPQQPQQPPKPPRPVICPDCEKPMQILKLEPHHRYINLDRIDYICDCGFSSYSLVAREE